MKNKYMMVFSVKFKKANFWSVIISNFAVNLDKQLRDHHQICCFSGLKDEDNTYDHLWQCYIKEIIVPNSKSNVDDNYTNAEPDVRFGE